MSLPESLHPAVNRTKLVWAMGITQILAWGSTYYLPAVLAAPIAQDTGWSTTSVVGGLSWGMVVAGATSPAVGRYIDRHGGRVAMALSSMLLVLGLAAMGLAKSLTAYYFAWSLIGIAMAAGLYDAAFSTLGRLLGDGARTSITGLTLLGGFASTVGWPVIAGIEGWLGWRDTCLAIAAAHLLVGLPVHALMIPGSLKQPLRPVVIGDVDPTLRSTRQSRVFFLLIGMMLTILALVVSGISVHLLDALKQLGIATAIALAIGMVIGPAQVAARIAEFSVGRNLHPTWSARVGVLLCLLGLGLLISGKPWLAFISIALYGAGNGILTIARGTLPLALFGAEGYGCRMGLLARPVLVAQACGPILAAWVLDTFGPQLLLSMLCCLLLICVAISFQLPAKSRTEI
ncbi:MFS transporter [Pseudomonas syringae pv. syringae]|nr:MFS transporter [Pseudomonas syringae]MCF4985167.1 MFS transporter [Pseudomonas syringae]MCF5203382.1 MFS transporter [Pseudomonas syringae]MCF5272830.1 MFS transporter [Pseudomonas syringae]MCF5274440.1 MFS transporter [Pseudomonas syringae]MCF5283007.1 MFS transporter [Pseudomonas syringae]